jgi:hypothetical protein
VEINRNQYFLIGLVILLLGLQLRAVDTFVLNEKTSRFVAEKVSAAEGDEARTYLASVGPAPRRTWRPPNWLGFAVMSVGGVLVLHSLAMKKPGG